MNQQIRVWKDDGGYPRQQDGSRSWVVTCDTIGDRGETLHEATLSVCLSRASSLATAREASVRLGLPYADRS